MEHVSGGALKAITLRLGEPLAAKLQLAARASETSVTELAKTAIEDLLERLTRQQDFRDGVTRVIAADQTAAADLLSPPGR